MRYFLIFMLMTVLCSCSNDEETEMAKTGACSTSLNFYVYSLANCQGTLNSMSSDSWCSQDYMQESCESEASIVVAFGTTCKNIYRTFYLSKSCPEVGFSLNCSGLYKVSC